MSDLQYLIQHRRTWIEQLRFCNRWSLPKSVVMKYLGAKTRRLTDEIRKVEKRLGRPHRYLPKAGFYQGVIHV